MKMRKPGNLIIALLIMSLISCGGATSQKKTGSTKDPMRGQAEGWAKIYDEDIALARDRAIDDARKKLVEKMLGSTVTGKSVVENYRLVSSILEAKSYGLVKDEVIIKEEREGTIYKVTIEGIVEPAAIDDLIKKAIKDYGRPKFIVLIDENMEGKNSAPGFTETEISIQEIMGNSGFQFIDGATVKDLMKKESVKMKKAMAGEISADVQQLLLDSIGAEVIISGTTVINDQSAVLQEYGSKNMKSKSAIVKLKAVDVYTGNILASISKQAAGIHIDSETAAKNAIGNCLKVIMGKNDETGNFTTGPFINTIVDKFVQSATHRQINISIAGLDYNDLTKFRNEISYRIRGVQEVLPKGQSGKYARLEVYFTGKTNDFADELVAKSGNLGFKIDILDSYPNRLTMKAVRIK